MRSTHRRYRRGVSIVDVAVIVVLVGLLAALWAPAVAKARDRSRRQQCSERLYRVRQALNDYFNAYKTPPRGRYVAGAPLDLSNDASKPNNVPAAAFLLIRTESLYATQLICPGGDFQADADADADPARRLNFADVRRNLGYSFAVPYTKDFGRFGGSNGNAIVADLNPGVAGANDDVRTPWNAPPDQLRKANSNNHGKRGQNVLLDDNSVRWVTTPYAGANGDNIYTTAAGKVVDVPTSNTDSIVLPTDD